MQLDITKVKLRIRDIKRENAVNRKMIFIMFLAVEEEPGCRKETNYQ